MPDQADRLNIGGKSEKNNKVATLRIKSLSSFPMKCHTYQTGFLVQLSFQTKYLCDVMSLDEMSCTPRNEAYMSLFVCLFVLLLYVPSQQLWSWRDGQFT